MSAGSLEKLTPSQTKTLLWFASNADILWSRHTLLSQERMDCVTNGFIAGTNGLSDKWIV